MWQKILSFRKKHYLSLLENLKLLGNHFSKLTKVMNKKKEMCEFFERYQTVLVSLIKEYDQRFKKLEKHEIL